MGSNEKRHDFLGVVADLTAVTSAVCEIYEHGLDYLLESVDRQSLDLIIAVLLRRISNRASYLLEQANDKLMDGDTDVSEVNMREEQRDFSGEETHSEQLRDVVVTLKKKRRSRKPKRAAVAP